MIADRYELRRRLGQGGMGEVWAAYDRTLDRAVAIKLIAALAGGSSGASEARGRFLREARITARLQHPGVVTVHDMGEAVTADGAMPFLVMELVRGEGLDAKLRRGLMPLRDTADWGQQICLALAAAHEGGVLHRDIKPANVMVTDQDRVVVLDFGIARATDPSSADARLTRTGFMVGTPQYMAPEQARGRPAPASDLYAVGCLMFEMLTGRLPFLATDAVSFLTAHLNDTPLHPSAFRPGIPEAWDHLIASLLAKDPEERPRSAAQLAGLLKRLGEPDRVPHPVSGAAPTEPNPLAPPAPTTAPSAAATPTAAEARTTTLGPQAWPADQHRHREAPIAPGRRRYVVPAVLLALVASTLVGAAVLKGMDESGTGSDNSTARSSPQLGMGEPASGGRLPVAAPPGWSQNPAWSVAVTAAAAKVPTVAASGSDVAAITPDRKLALLDPASGRTRRVVELPTGDLRGLRLGLVDGRPTALVHVGSKLVCAPTDGTDPAIVLDLPSDAISVSVAGDSPLVSASSGASTVANGALKPLQLPSRAVAMAVDGQTLLAADAQGTWWRIPAGQAPVETTPAPPSPNAQVVGVAAAGHGRMVLVWTGPSERVATVVVYDAATGQAQTTIEASADALAKATWVSGADGRIAALGPIVFDLLLRTAVLHEGITPIVAFGTSVAGYVNRTATIIDVNTPDAAPLTLPPGTPLPLGAPTGRLLITITDASGAASLYALTRDTGAGAATLGT